MIWNYRLVRRTHPDGTRTFAIHEAYYDQAGKVEHITRDPVEVFGESRREALRDFMAMAAAFRAPVLRWERVPETGAAPGPRRGGKKRRTGGPRRSAARSGPQGGR